MSNSTQEADNRAAFHAYLTLRGHTISWDSPHRVGQSWRSSRPPGWADGIGFTRDGRFLAVERKREFGDVGEHGEKGRKRFELQRQFGQKVIAAGGVWVMARSVKDLEEAGL